MGNLVLPVLLMFRKARGVSNGTGNGVPKPYQVLEWSLCQTNGVSFFPPMTDVTSHRSSYILGWNEPNFKKQSNINPTSTVIHERWKELYYAAKNASKLLGAPQVAGCGGENCNPSAGSGVQQWLVPFWTGVCPKCVPKGGTKPVLNKKCCPFLPDFAATHIYFNNADNAMNLLQEHIDFYPGLPVWVTEFGVTIQPTKKERAETVLFDFIGRLMAKKEVFRASYYIYTLLDGSGLPMYDSNGLLTSTGKRYLNSVNRRS